MKLIKYILFIIATQTCFLSCKREFNNVKTGPISGITVVNAVVNANPLIADFSGADSVAAYYSTTQQIGYGSFLEYSIPSNNTPVVVYQISDTNRALYKNILNLEASAVYSLFLSGSDTTHIDTLITQDHPPYHSNSDSTAGIRFINLSSGGNPISMNIQGNPNGSEVSSLAYQSITSFKSYAVTQSTAQYIFEIRDVVSGDLLKALTYSVIPFQNVTIVVNGISGETGNKALGAFIVNNF